MAERAERFRAIMLPHMDAAYSLARYLTRDPVTAEDVVQEAYLSAFRKFDDWRGGAPKAWLLAIVRNCFLTGLRRSTMTTSIDAADNVPLDEPTPEEALIEQRELASMYEEIGRMPVKFREVLILRELEELSYKEIATIVDVPMGTVMSRLARARQMLADRILAPELSGTAE